MKIRLDVIVIIVYNITILYSGDRPMITKQDQAWWDAAERYADALAIRGFSGVGPRSTREQYPAVPPWRTEEEGPFDAVNPDTSRFNGDVVAAFNDEIRRIHQWVEEQEKADHRQDLDVIRGLLAEGLSTGQIMAKMTDYTRTDAMKLINEAKRTW